MAIERGAFCDTMTLPLESLTAAHFDPHVGTNFHLRVDETQEVVLALVAVRSLGHRRSEASRDPFALDFLGPAGMRLMQGIVSLSHPVAGTLEVFLTQVADKPDGSLFEVIFT